MIHIGAGYYVQIRVFVFGPRFSMDRDKSNVFENDFAKIFPIASITLN